VDRNVRKARRLSVVLLNRGGKFSRPTLFAELERLGIEEILSIESSDAAYDVESLARSYTGVRFLLLKQEATVGEQINLGIEESVGRYVLVLWNDMRLPSFSQRSLDRIAELESLCVVPVLRNQRLEMIPAVMAPAFYNGQLKVLPLTAQEDGVPSLYPYDYVGVYNRDKFLFCGGFDGNITKSYWQKLDFGFRVFMWGESIRSHLNLKVNCLGNQEPEDTTPDESYKRFYLKNLSVRFQEDQGVLPFTRFLPFWMRTSGGLFESYRIFREIQAWVFRNRYLFKQDARRITELWEVGE
jgi:hypothetical protein